MNGKMQLPWVCAVRGDYTPSPLTGAWTHGRAEALAFYIPLQMWNDKAKQIQIFVVVFFFFFFFLIRTL